MAQRATGSAPTPPSGNPCPLVPATNSGGLVGLGGNVWGPAFLPGSNVQLPSFSYFGTQTSVSVPDGGGVLLGGVNGAGEGGNQFGPNRSAGSQIQSRQMQVGVQIHDMAELDAQVLAAAAPPKPAGPPDANALALRGAQASSAGNGAMSVAEARRLHEDPIRRPERRGPEMVRAWPAGRERRQAGYGQNLLPNGGPPRRRPPAGNRHPAPAWPGRRAGNRGGGAG